MRGKVSIILMVGFVVSLCALTTLAQAEEQKRAAIIYSSRYGSTAQTANWIAEGMDGKTDVIAAKEAGDLTSYDFIILGSGIYMDQLHEDMQTFLAKNKEAIKDKIIAFFVVCGTPPDLAQGYLDMFAEKCGAKPSLMKVFGGWLKKELLSSEDYKIIEAYFKSINQPFEDSDDTDKTKCLEFGKEILKAISSSIKK